MKKSIELKNLDYVLEYHTWKKEYDKWQESTMRYILRLDYSHGWMPGKFKFTHYHNMPSTVPTNIHVFINDQDRIMYVRHNGEFTKATKEILLTPNNYALRESYCSALEGCRIGATPRKKLFPRMKPKKQSMDHPFNEFTK